jgi:uncharacterized protein
MTGEEIRILNETRIFARERMSGVSPSHGWDHVLRVEKTAEKISDTEPSADKFIIKLAALLHDICREQEDRSKGEICHAEQGARDAFSFLHSIGLDVKICSRVSDCIKFHRFRKKSNEENNEQFSEPSIESKILFDADKLDSIGAAGIGRAFLFAGEVGAKLHNQSDNISGTSSYSEEDTAFREYEVKLKHIRNKLFTEEGKRIARDRDDFMMVFFDRLRKEMKGEI